MTARGPLWRHSSWRECFLGTLVVLQASSLFCSMMLSSYGEFKPTEHLSFYVSDGWCDPAEAGIGGHCFGDFQFPKQLMSETSVLNNSLGIPHPYFPSTTALHRLFEFPSLSDRADLLVYLVVLALVGLIPGLLLGNRLGTFSQKVLALLGLGFLSLPFLIAIDRGNSVMIAVGLAAFAVQASRADNARSFVLWAIAASLVRPQLLLLVIIGPVTEGLRSAVKVVTGFLFVQTVLFVITPGYRINDWLLLVDKLQEFSRSSPVDRPYVVNLYLGRSLYLLGQWFGFEDAVASLFRSEVVPTILFSMAGLLGALVAFHCRAKVFSLSVVLWTTLTIILPSVSYLYYLGVAVVCALVLLDGHDNVRRDLGPLLGALVGTSLLVSLVPFPFLYGSTGMSYGSTLAGVLWLLVFVVAVPKAVRVSRTMRVEGRVTN